VNLNLRTLGLVIVLLASSMVKADHTSPSGSVSRLMYEAQELARGVRYFGLNYNVVQAVDRFNYDVNRLGNCVQFGGRRSMLGERENTAGHIEAPIVRDHSDPRDDFGIPYQCRSYLDMVRRSFYPVERYLSDTYYDYPQLYRNYREVREALYAIQVSGEFPGPVPGPFPGPGPANVMCIAVDAGWEEHASSHVGYGRFIGEAQRAALMACQRFHGRCRIRECR